MSNCKYTELVTPNTCLGDSLATFNQNFSNLDNALCSQPVVIPGTGVRVTRFISEQNITTTQFATTPAALYSAFFEDMRNGVTAKNVTLEDNTSIRATSFPVPPTSATSPFATFSAISLSNTSPKVTVFWTASGADYTTVYAINSATSVSTDIGTGGGFNGPITCFLSAGSFIYVGGAFTSVGKYPFGKLCAIDITKGSASNYTDELGNLIEGDLGVVGEIVEKPIYDTVTRRYIVHPLLENGGFGPEGAITSLLQNGDLLIIGGTYKNVPGKNLGRGLTIWNSKSKRVYPFYVNGDVNALYVQDNELYIGGSFNFINYGPTSASDISGQRIYANGLAKISLPLIESFANKSIVQTFCENTINILEKQAIIYTICCATEGSGTIYIGGDFKSYQQRKLVASGLAVLSPDGTLGTTWQPIIEGVVHKLLIDEQTLYAGGVIQNYLTAPDLDIAPRPVNRYYNLICFDITLSYSPVLVNSWKPKVNGPVMDMAVHNGYDGTEFIYCYGNFDDINDVSVNFIGAVPKNAGEINNINEGRTSVNWRIQLDKPPQVNSKGLLRISESILIGGTFSQINGKPRRYLGLVNGPYEQIMLENPPQVVWNLGAQLLCPGGSLSLDFTNVASITAGSVKFGNINKSIFPLDYTKSVFEGYNQGSLMRFFLRRQYDTTADTLSSEAYVVGWRIEFDN